MQSERLPKHLLKKLVDIHAFVVYSFSSGLGTNQNKGKLIVRRLLGTIEYRLKKGLGSRRFLCRCSSKLIDYI